MTHVCFRSGLHTWEEGARARGRCDITRSHSSGGRCRRFLPPEPERSPVLRSSVLRRSVSQLRHQPLRVSPTTTARRFRLLHTHTHTRVIALSCAHTHKQTDCGEGRKTLHTEASDREREREQRRRGGLSTQSGRGEEVNNLIGASPLSPD